MTDNARYGWGRPNPPRLNDTDALVRKGTYPYTYLPRGGGGFPAHLLELRYTAEVAFNGRSSTKFASKPNAGDENIANACTQIPKGC